MNASPTIAIAELVSTLEISPRLARPMKMTPSTASRIGAMLPAKNPTTPSVSMPLGAGAAPVGQGGADDDAGGFVGVDVAEHVRRADHGQRDLPRGERIDAERQQVVQEHEDGHE